MKPELSSFENELFQIRKKAHLEDAVYALSQLYGDRHDFRDWVDRCLEVVHQAFVSRPLDLKRLDLARAERPDWYLSQDMVGYICYTDRFCDTLANLPEKIPYLKELGITYLHLMPLLQPCPEPNDGGYAVEDYRQVNARLGTIEELAVAAEALRSKGISLCTDLVCNHTADTHEWAKKAKAGNKAYQDYFLFFPDRNLPNRYEESLRDIFPETAPGNFLYIEEIDQWVWSTFNPYQWDLNYANPAVFVEMLDIILNLANHGVEILRMDAVAFMWKALGTSCENLPQAHAILQAFRALTKIAAPALIFKAEAIVAPDDVVPYLGEGKMAGKECELAYHNSLMVYMWSMLAEQKTTLSTYSLQQLPVLPESAGWVTYVRCHDDIGWAIMDHYADAVGLSGFAHRAFLSEFYNGNFSPSWSIGDLFQFNPETGDKRICGSTASLIGLEKGYSSGLQAEVDLAIRRILLIHNVIFASGGIPLIYMGDELGLLNDYTYLDDAEKADDNRWLQRPLMDWELSKHRDNRSTPTGQIFSGLKKLSAARKSIVALHGQAKSEPVWIHNNHLFGLRRSSARGELLLLANFSPHRQTVSASRLQALGMHTALGDVLTGQPIQSDVDLQLDGYEAIWLVNNLADLIP